MRVDKQTNEKIGFLAEKYGKDVKDLKDRLVVLATEIKDAHPDRGNNTCIALGRRQLIIELRGSRRRPRTSNAGTEMSGFILGVDRLRDRAEKYNEAYERGSAVIGKVKTDKVSNLPLMLGEDGERLDMRKTVYSRDNWGYGKPLPAHDYHRVIHGIAAAGDSSPEWFVSHVYGDLAAELQSTDVMKPVSFNAMVKENRGDNGELLLTLKSTPTINKSLPLTVDQAAQFCETLTIGNTARKIELGDIMEFIDEHWEGEWSTTEFLVEADVDSIWPSDYGGRIYLSDESLEFLDDEFDSVMGWFRDDLNLNFAEGSRLLLCCNAFRKKGWDRELQQETDEWGDPQVNILGWHPLPDFFVPRMESETAGPIEEEE